jgi:bifunctional non-homologous end joining protein LigD
MGRWAGTLAERTAARYSGPDVSLERYKRKRDFRLTPEPSGEGLPDSDPATETASEPTRAGNAPAGEVGSFGGRDAGSAAGPSRATPGPGSKPVSGLATGRFVVQRHRARNLHYDFRLEIEGVLVSWAVPKGPTLDPALRRGAYHVEDHPLDYFDFEGTIPRGQYGAGDVIVWDWGRFRAEATNDPGRAVRDGELKFELFGEKLRGRFTIVRTRGGSGRSGGATTGVPDPSEREEWLLIKKRDDASRTGWDPEALPRSVKTGQTNDEVLAGVAPARGSTRGSSSAALPSMPLLSPAEVPGAHAAQMPAFIEPMKATLSDRPFSDPAWLFELKWDGYRVHCHVRDGRVALFTRRGQNAATYFPELAGRPTWLAAGEAILDGEVVALDSAGEPSFGLL